MLANVFSGFFKRFGINPLRGSKPLFSFRKGAFLSDVKEIYHDLKGIFTDSQDKYFRYVFGGVILFTAFFTAFDIYFNENDPAFISSKQRISYMIKLIEKDKIERMAREGERVREKLHSTNSLTKFQSAASDYVFPYKFAKNRNVSFVLDPEINYYTPIDYKTIDLTKPYVAYDILFDVLYSSSHCNSSRDVFCGINHAGNFVEKAIESKEKSNELLWKYDVLSSDIEVFNRNMKEAISYLKKALNKIPEECTELRMAIKCKLALKYAFTGNTEKGVDLCLDIIKNLNENSPKIFAITASYSLGLLLEVSGKIEEARNLFDLTLDLSKDENPEVNKAMKINITSFKKTHKLT